MKAALYLRVSSDKQAKEGDSLPAQHEALVKYCAEHGHTIAGEYIDDGISGTKYSERDELQRMLSDIEDGKANLILFTKLDRFFRSVRHYTATQETLDRHGVGWLAIWEPYYNTTTPAGRLIINQMMSIAQFEAENTSTRIKQVQAYKVRQGEVISGSTPPGLTIRDKHLVPDENADAVRAVFEYYAFTGNLRDTLRYSARFGCFPTGQACLRQILQNRKYIGQYRDNDNFCEPIISEALFDDVQRKLAMNVKISQKRTYLFSGLVRCAECGTRMGTNKRTVKGRIDVTYRCTKHYSRAFASCQNAKVIKEHLLEAHLLEILRPTLQKIVLDFDISEKKDDGKRERANIEEKLERIKELYIDGVIDKAEYTKRKEEQERKLSEIRTSSEHDITMLKEVLKMDIESIYGTFTPEEKRYFWRQIIKEIRFGIDRKIEVLFL